MAISKDPTNDEAWFNKGYTLCLLKRPEKYPEAIECFSSCNFHTLHLDIARDRFNEVIGDCEEKYPEAIKKIRMSLEES